MIERETIEEQIAEFAQKIKPDFDPFASTSQSFTKEIELGGAELKVEVYITLKRNKHTEQINGVTYTVSDLLEIEDVEYYCELLDLHSGKVIFGGESRYVDLIIDDNISF